MDSIVDSFLSEYSVTDPGAKDSLIEVINSCFKVYAQYMSKDLLDSKDSSQKKPKAAKPKGATILENPADATSLEQLGECTIQVLSKFCKERSLKVGGKKDSVSLRVWRFLQGETSDEDRSSASKTPRAAKDPKDPKGPKGSTTTNPHGCCGMTKSGAQCVLVGTKESGGLYYCFRHCPNDPGIQSPEPGSESEPGSEPGSEPEPEAEESKDPKKTAKTPKKTAKTPKKSKIIQLDSESE